MLTKIVPNCIPSRKDWPFHGCLATNLYVKEAQLLAFNRNFKTESGKKKVKLADLAYLECAGEELANTKD
jgi:hypothetical protein